MRLVSPSGWAIEVEAPEQAAWIMASYDKSMQLLNTQTDIADVDKAKPEDFDVH